MKCKVCGYEVDAGRGYCPMCGAKQEAQVSVSAESRRAKSEQINWNTKDFPKPRKVEDIEMNWGGGFNTFMSKDASEGSASVEKYGPNVGVQRVYTPPVMPSSFAAQPVPQTQFAARQTAPAQPQMQPQVQPQMQPQVQPQMQPQVQPQMQPQVQVQPQVQPAAPVQQPAQQSQPQYWYTQNFTATGVMKTGPAFPILDRRDDVKFENVKTEYSPAPAPFESAPSSFEPARAPFEPARTPFEPARAPFEPAPAREEKKPEMFHTFVSKNDEFQKLLDREYERAKDFTKNEEEILRRRETAPQPAFVAETSVQAQDINSFERSLFGQDAVPIHFEHESDETDLDLNELISDPLNPNFDIHTIEMTIHRLEEEDKKEEAERNERQARLEKMRAARDAYFKLLDESEFPNRKKSKFEPVLKNFKSEVTPIRYDKPVSHISDEEVAETARVVSASSLSHDFTVIDNPENPAEAASASAVPGTSAQTSAAQALGAAEQTAALAAGASEENSALTENAERESEASAASQSGETNSGNASSEYPQNAQAEASSEGGASSDNSDMSDTQRIQNELMNLYDREDEQEKKKSHGFLKFLLVLVLLVVIAEIVVICCRTFAPQAQFTLQAVKIESAVIEALLEFGVMVSDWVSSLIAK